MSNLYTRVCLILSLIVMACSSISPYNPRAYEYATSSKAEALTLMDKAVEPFHKYRKEVESLRLNLEKAYEYARGLPKNEITTEQWAILKNPKGHLLGGFLKRWEEKSTLSAGFVNSAKGLIADGFDTIIGLESGKLKSSEIRQIGE